MERDLPAIVVTAVYFTLLFVLVERLRRKRRVAPDITRKIFLIGASAWALAATRVFITPNGILAVYGALALILYLSFRFELFVGIEDFGPSLGPVFCALASGALLVMFWNGRLELAEAAILGSGSGDAAAALVGKRIGTRKFRSFAHVRSMEGTLAMFLVCGLVMAPILARSSGIGWHQAIAFSLITATVGASVEAVSAYSLDNITVPFATAATFILLFQFSQ